MLDDAVRKVPSRSIDSSTTSPGWSQPPACSGVSSRMQPVPTVPEPITSPGRSVASRLACASNCGQVQYIVPELPRDSKRPFRPRGHLQVQPAVAVAVGQLVERHQLGAQRGREVLPLARPQADGHLDALEVPRAPVVHDREAGDGLERPVVVGQVAGLAADHAGQLQLVVEGLAPRGAQTSASWPMTPAGLEK